MTRKTGFRLSPQQARLWSLVYAGPAEIYRARGLFLVDGEVEIARLERAILDVIERHEILRTVYPPLPGTDTAAQLPLDAADIVIERIDGLTDGRADEEEARFDALFEERRRSPLAIDGRSPLRVAIAALHARRCALLVELPALSADRRTLANLAREIGRAYAARLDSAALPEPAQYADVAEVFNELLESEETAAGRRRWREMDLSALTALSLPSAQPAPERGFDPRRTIWPVPPELGLAIHTSSARAGVSAATFLLACWQILLHRLSGQPIWSVAVSHDGRTYEGLDEAMGLFERYLPLSCAIDEHRRFEDFARDVDRAGEEVVEWQDYFDGASLLRASSPGGRPPSFPFAFEHAPWPTEVHLANLAITALRLESCVERFDLKLACVERAGSLDVELHHDAGRHGAADAARLLERYQAILAGAAADPGRAIDDLPIVGEHEQRLLDAFNQTARDVPTALCLHELFQAQARRIPERDAVVFGEERLSYAELAARTNRLAHHLRRLGVRPDARVGLCLTRSVELLVAILAILAAGGAYVPIDPTLPRERMALLLRESGAVLVVTRSELAPALPDGPTRLVVLDTEAQAIAEQPATPPESTTRPDHLAYVIYTSGSTGEPKGVMVEHRSVVNLAAALRGAIYAGRGEGLRVSLSAPIAFDASVKQWIQLLDGHTVHVVPEEARPDGARLCAFIEQSSLDVLDCTPSQLGALLARGLGREQRISPRVVLVGGEDLDGRTWTELAASPATEFFNVYGPTECTVDATICAARASSAPRIGRPLGNVRVHVLDRHLRRVPIGVAGEIGIAGAGVARGYLGRPELTAERFVADPFGAPGERLYRTGDRGRVHEDGTVEFLGRIDHQVKLRGYRIEPGEIEAALRAHPRVEDAVVVVRELSPGEPHLVAYVVPKAIPGAGADDLSSDLRAALRRSLPEYMIPAALIPIARMPLGPNGKLDRGALPDPRGRSTEIGAYEPPASAIERRLALIWREVLGVEQVGLHDNFFDLGGHSLLMVKLQDKLSEAFGKRFPLVDLFRYPTIGSLASHVDPPEPAEPPGPGAVVDRARQQQQAMQAQARLGRTSRGKR